MKKFISIEKLDTKRAAKEKKLFYSLLIEPIQKLRNGDAIVIWVYLSSLPPTWVVSRTQLRQHLRISSVKVNKALALLKSCNLIDYIQERREDNTFGNLSIKVLAGYAFKVPVDKSKKDNKIKDIDTIPEDRKANGKEENNSFPATPETRCTGKRDTIKLDLIIDRDKRRYLDIVCSSKDGAQSLFKIFYSACKRKKNPKKAEEEWNKKNCDRDFETIMRWLTWNNENNFQWKDPRFNPHPYTIIRNELWKEPLVKDNMDMKGAKEQTAAQKLAAKYYPLHKD